MYNLALALLAKRASEMANLSFQNFANEGNGNVKKKLGQVFCYFGKSKFPKSCRIGKKLAKKVSLEMTLKHHQVVDSGQQ